MASSQLCEPDRVNDNRDGSRRGRWMKPRLRYTPYGAQRGTANKLDPVTDTGFLGQTEDHQTKLMVPAITVQEAHHGRTATMKEEHHGFLRRNY